MRPQPFGLHFDFLELDDIKQGRSPSCLCYKVNIVILNWLFWWAARFHHRSKLFGHFSRYSMQRGNLAVFIDLHTLRQAGHDLSSLSSLYIVFMPMPLFYAHVHSSTTMSFQNVTSSLPFLLGSRCNSAFDDVLAGTQHGLGMCLPSSRLIRFWMSEWASRGKCPEGHLRPVSSASL